MTEDTPYVHGHAEAVLRSHRWRTAANSAGFLLGHLRPGLRLLDVGCGPGSITAELADLVAPGDVVGIDRDQGVINAAARDNQRDNLTFAVGDLYDLDAGLGTFDVIFLHQVLQHLTDPVGALRVLAERLRPGGIIAARDGDYGAFTWTPPNPMLTQWLSIYDHIARGTGGEPNAGRFLVQWANEAGLEVVSEGSSSWEFTTVEDVEFWGNMWADRVISSNFASHALDLGVCDQDTLRALRAGWLEWTKSEGATFAVPSGEVIAQRP